MTDAGVASRKSDHLAPTASWQSATRLGAVTRRLSPVQAAQYSRTVESNSPNDKGFWSTRVAPAGARIETDE